MRIIVHDFAGHPFQVQLSRQLADRGHRVLHLTFGGMLTPKGDLARRADDPATLEIEVLELGEPFAKYRFARRLWQERRIGRLLAARIRSFAPDVVISGNAPIVVQAAARGATQGAGGAFVLWVQDVHSVAIERHLRDRAGWLGAQAARPFALAERLVARGSDHVVVISEDFRPLLLGWGVPDERITTVENWAPLDGIGPRPRANPWAAEHGLVDGPVALYSGSLGLKHNPAQLLDVARAFRAERPDARLVVVSEGLGADWLRERADGLPTLVLLPFQPFDRLADVIGAADVVLAILEPDAGVFSVPSKVLSYMAAGRPIAAAMPADNLAARLVERVGSGVVVSPTDAGSLAGACLDLLARPADAAAMGERGRAYAAQAFDAARITDRFEALLGASIAGRAGVLRRATS